MALDVYVGGLCRYFSREWENVVQKWARESGTEYRQIGPDGPPAVADWDEVGRAMANWLEAINRGLGDNLGSPLSWDETRDAPYFTDRPGYDVYGALVVWAAHAEAGSVPPEGSHAEWYEDEAFVEASTPKQGQKYRAITCGSLWLPGEFPFSFDFESLTGEKVHICSNQALLQALIDLNEQTFGFSDEEVEALRQTDFAEEPTTERLAALGFAVFWELCCRSVEHHLPILLDT